MDTENILEKEVDQRFNRYGHCCRILNLQNWIVCCGEVSVGLFIHIRGDSKGVQ